MVQNYNKNNHQKNNKSFGQNRGPLTLPQGYLANGYYTDSEKEKLNPDYVVIYAKTIASLIEQEGNNKANKRTQIRKYYDYCIRIKDKMQHKKNDFSYVEADFAALLAKVSYAKSRSTVSNIFVDFIKDNINVVQDAKDFRAFIKHFEAIIAFMKKD